MSYLLQQIILWQVYTQSGMNITQEYGLKCLVTAENNVMLLHIEVRSKNFPEQCYSRHLGFEELSHPLQNIFNNISHLYVYMNQPQVVYFDDVDSAIKICIPIAGEIREFPIGLNSKGRSEGLKRKIILMEQEKARLTDEFSKLKQDKQNELQEARKKLVKERQQKQSLQKILQELELDMQKKQRQVAELRRESELKMQLVHCLNSSKGKSEYIQTPLKQNKLEGDVLVSPNVKQERKTSEMSELDRKKKYWIDEVGALKKSKVISLKRLIHPQAKFEEQIVLSVNNIDLKKMLFVEIFLNLQIIDISQNRIRTMEGLQQLKNLLKLDLSQNAIESISGLSKNHRLSELILHTNKIKVISNIFHLSNLRILSLSKNQIESVPDQIGRLHNLVQLRMAHNQIKNISNRVESLRHLKIFTILGNKCYSERNRSKEIIDRLLQNGVKTTTTEFL